MTNRGIKFYIDVSKKYKPDPSCPDYLIKGNYLLGWITSYPQRVKPKTTPYFKRGCWYYPMSLIHEFAVKKKRLKI